MAIIPIRQNLLCFELGLRPDLTGGRNESSRVAFHFSQGTSNSFAESITAADFGEFLSERQSLLDAIEHRLVKERVDLPPNLHCIRNRAARSEGKWPTRCVAVSSA